MTEPRISVIIPVYNVELYLRRCVDSVISQDYTDLEIILVDDGSSDNSGAICDEYANKDERIKVIHQANMGLHGARNTGMEAAFGEYISFIDSDDWIEAGTYTYMMKIVDSCHPDMIRFGFKKVLNGRILADKKMPYEAGMYEGEAIRTLQLDIISNENVLDYKKTRILSSWSGLYRRGLIIKQDIHFMPVDEILNEDYFFVLQVSLAAKSIYVSDKSFYYYDTREGSITMSYRQNMVSRKKKLYHMYCCNLDMNDKDVRIRLKNFYIDCIYACIVNECSGYRSRIDSVTAIRGLLQDEKLQRYLTDNRRLVHSLRTKCICFLMRHKLALVMHDSYRLMKSLKSRREA
ncbi:MAG: glycosyltransferase family 2 protein [Blautia sp.]